MELAGLHPTKPEQNQEGDSAQVWVGDMGSGCRDVSMPFPSWPYSHDDCLAQQHFGLISLNMCVCCCFERGTRSTVLR